MRDGMGCLALAAITVALVAVLVAVGAFFITLVWPWVVPDVFAGAVQQGILPGSLTFWQAVKLMILFAVLGLTSHARSSSKS
jgi:hypothetical protein